MQCDKANVNANARAALGTSLLWYCAVLCSVVVPRPLAVRTMASVADFPSVVIRLCPKRGRVKIVLGSGQGLRSWRRPEQGLKVKVGLRLQTRVVSGWTRMVKWEVTTAHVKGSNGSFQGAP